MKQKQSWGSRLGKGLGGQQQPCDSFTHSLNSPQHHGADSLGDTGVNQRIM